LKKHIGLITVLFLFAFIFTSCETDLENKFTFQNYSAGKVLINFRGSLHSVNAGAIYTINKVPKGTYDYSTTYEVPFGTTGSSAQGALDGTVEFKVSTRVLIVYSSTFNDSAYTIYATISSTDDLSGGDSEGPTFP
jgi:hypothetical protein